MLGSAQDAEDALQETLLVLAARAFHGPCGHEIATSRPPSLSIQVRSLDDIAILTGMLNPPVNSALS
jgi:hypothetical protein